MKRASQIFGKRSSSSPIAVNESIDLPDYVPSEEEEDEIDSSLFSLLPSDFKGVLRQLTDPQYALSQSWSKTMDGASLAQILEGNYPNLDFSHFDMDQCTLLTVTVTKQNLAIFQSLMRISAQSNRKLDLNQPDLDGWTALHVACEMGCLNFVDQLIECGADVNVKNKDGNTPVHYLVRYNGEDTNFIAVLNKAIKQLSDINCRNNHDETLFHQACARGNIKSITHLLERGGSPELANDRGETGLNYAIKMDDTGVLASQILQILENMPNRNKSIPRRSVRRTANFLTMSGKIVEDFVEMKKAGFLGSSTDESVTDSHLVPPQPVISEPEPISCGSRPKYPVVLIPGLAGTALSVWKSPEPSWFRTRLWVSVGKLGKTKKAWLQHLLLDENHEDPEGIKVRPLDGLNAIDNLDHGIFKTSTYVFSHIIEKLASVGYDPSNLAGIPYDWRLPPKKAQERDGMFSKMKKTIEELRERNGEKVLLIAHSMGNKFLQYFYQWIIKHYQESWIDENVHMQIAIAAPFLGSPKAVRGAITGDKFGMDLFLNDDEGRVLTRSLGSLPLLFPIRQDLWGIPSFVYFHNSNNEKYNLTKSIEAVKEAGPRVWSNFNEYFLKDELLYKSDDTNNPENPSSQAPPVKNLVAIYGTNVKTEVFCFLKKFKGEFRSDPAADKITGIGDYEVKNGIAYETKATYHPSAKKCASGDGTVPYTSLHVPSMWRKEKKKVGQKIGIHELEGLDHIGILADPSTLSILLQYATGALNIVE